MPFTAPTLDEQRIIVNFLRNKLDSIDQTLDKATRSLDILEENRSALITQAVTKGLNPDVDRKSTRLNSSHKPISYAVFCLKKKKQNKNTHNKTNKQKNTNKKRESQTRHNKVTPPPQC